MAEWKAKRFWKTTEVAEVEGGYEVRLDGRPVRTPAKAPLVVPTRELAEEIAREWEAQVEEIDPTVMPFTRGANAAIDKVSIQHSEVADMLAEYGDSDLLCYRAEAPDVLVERQNATWDPLLGWLSETYGATLLPRTGIMHAAQDAEALAKLRKRVHAMSPFELAAFHDLVSMSGSLVIGLAATDKHLDVDTLWAASRVDEDFQIEQWGADEEEAELVAEKHASFRRAYLFYHMVQK